MKTWIRQKEIAILVCYFGKFPWYFKYFIHSCGYNKTIDFILISDTKSIHNLPKNVKHIYHTLDDINELTSRKLGFQTNIENGYKFSDFKPAYGFLFSELIDGYDFWGQSDVDVILGDLRQFLNKEMLKNYDYISVRHDFPTGCFSIFRNNSPVNILFKRSKDYEMVFKSSKHFCFDECNNVHKELTEGKSIFELDTEIESFMHLLKTAELNNEIKSHFDFICLEGATGKITFDHGKIVYDNKFEVILYHLIFFKKVYAPKAIPRIIPDVYHISSNEICFKNDAENGALPELKLYD